MRTCQVTAFIFLLCAILPWAAGMAGEQASPLEGTGVKAIKAARIYTGDGAVVKNGIVIVRDGKIDLMGTNVEVPDGAKVYAHDGEFCLTPGLIDAASTAGVISRNSWAEHSSEVIPHMLNLDALDLNAKSFERLAAKGVTTVYISPDPASIIGCQGVVVKTGGPEKARILKKQAGVKATIGPEGWRRGARNQAPRTGRVTFLTRRPTTRMGMAWVFRKAFYDAMACMEALKAGSQEGAPDPATAMLIRVLEGKIPLRIQAREDIDIWSAIRMGEEFGLTFVIEEGTEAYRCIPELKEYGAPVIFGPIFVRPSGSRAASGELLRPCLNTAGMLAEAGITLALTAGGLEGEDALPHQACFAIRHGLAFEDALKATTRTPAKLIGIGNRTGTLKQGMDGDMVLWNGTPFSPTARPVLVLIGGEVAYMDEEFSEKQ